MIKSVAVVGLGYVGLPLASLCADKGYKVIAYDYNESISRTLLSGKIHIKDKEVESLWKRALASNNLSPTSDSELLRDCNIFLVCVPTPVDENHDPDLTPLFGALDVISPHIKQSDLVVIESTVFPGTCDDVLSPYIENKTGKIAGKDYHLAHCPERVNPGDSFWTTENIPRVVGATSMEGTREAASFYSSLLGGKVFDVRDIRGLMRPKVSPSDCENGYTTKRIPSGSITMMHSIRDAEAVKVMENTVRDVNIAFVNELAKISDVLDLDVVDVIDGMSTKPFGTGPFFPGTGVGGHCIAVDPEWLKNASIKAGYMPEIIQLVRNTNNGMPAYAVSLLQDALNERGYPIKGTKIALLGVAYKKNVDDPRESPFYDIRQLLLSKGGDVAVYDSWINSENTVDSLEDAIDGCKAIFIVTDHDNFVEKLSSMNFIEAGVEVIIDGRNCLDSDSLSSQGVLYRGIGRR